LSSNWRDPIVKVGQTCRKLDIREDFTTETSYKMETWEGRR
jgi:hypothetical protein